MSILGPPLSQTTTGVDISTTNIPLNVTGTAVLGVGSWNTFTVDPLQNQVDEIQKFVNELKAERELRKKYPALDHIYEQYEVMLEICKSKEADDAAGENSK